MYDFLKKTITWAFSIITAIFTFVPEVAFEICKWTQRNAVNITINRIILLSIIIALTAIIYGIHQTIRRKVTIKGENYSVQIEYGDIFEMLDCKKIIAFDECFTTEIGNAPHEIKEKSICGQYLRKHPIENIQALIDVARLKPSRSKSKYQGKLKYDSGMLLPREDYLLVAFAKLDETGNGYLSLDELLDCLSLLWKEINKYYAQCDVCVPILGSGITRIKGEQISQQKLLDIIISSYQLSAHKIKEPCKLRIVCKKSRNFSLNRIGQNL